MTTDANGRRVWILAGILLAVAGVAAYMKRAQIGAALQSAANYVLGAGGLKLLEFFEGKENRAYRDVVGLWTIGIGHLIKPDEMDKYVGKVVIINGKERGSVVLTDDQVYELKRQDAAIATAALKKYVQVPISTNMGDALLSLIFNIGTGAFANSTLLRKLNAGDYAGAAEQFLVWNKAGGRVIQGLANRREAERRLFLS